MKKTIGNHSVIIESKVPTLMLAGVVEYALKSFIETGKSFFQLAYYTVRVNKESEDYIVTVE